MTPKPSFFLAIVSTSLTSLWENFCRFLTQTSARTEPRTATRVRVHACALGGIGAGMAMRYWRHKVPTLSTRVTNKKITKLKKNTINQTTNQIFRKQTNKQKHQRGPPPPPPPPPPCLYCSVTSWSPRLGPGGGGASPEVGGAGSVCVWHNRVHLCVASSTSSCATLQLPPLRPPPLPPLPLRVYFLWAEPNCRVRSGTGVCVRLYTCVFVREQASKRRLHIHTHTHIQV